MANTPGKPLFLAHNEIHLWACFPQRIKEPLVLQRYRQFLNEEETAKVARYKFDHLRHDALITRALVRTVLSKYADVTPEAWCFEKGEKDKPEIVNPPLPLRFNISHTTELIVCAVALEYDLGADVEYIGRNTDVLGITDRYFSTVEIDELFSLPSEAQQRSRFFDYWTLKESYIKAWGGGLSIPLDQFSFHIGEADQADALHYCNRNIRLSFAPQREDNPQDWQSWLFYPSAEHRMAVSIRAGHQSPYTLRLYKTVPLLSDAELLLPFD